MQGCSISSTCKNIKTQNRKYNRDNSCSCFELTKIGGGFVGGSIDAKSIGLYQALVIHSDSLLDYFENDTLRWSKKFSFYQRQIKGTKITMTAMDLGWGDINPVYSFQGKDTIIIFNAETIDDSPLMFVREY